MRGHREELGPVLAPIPALALALVPPYSLQHLHFLAAPQYVPPSNLPSCSPLLSRSRILISTRFMHGCDTFNEHMLDLGKGGGKGKGNEPSGFSDIGQRVFWH